ncbi:PKD domain-containing protein [Roseivirga pacifica]|uniref:PKD domain-containing protein n=1 Tax=Roseivirga pacifica TaxID=1267423 RepID=UPI003BABB198
MQIVTIKKSFTRIIVLFVAFLCVNSTALFGQDTGDPVISTVNVNSCLGIITLSVDGDKPFTYEWKDSGGTVVGSTRSIAGLTPGDYTVTITDNDGDTTTATYTITSPPNLTGDVTVNDVTCRGDADAQVVVDMINGNSPYSWELFNSGGASIQTGSTPAGFTIITLNGLGVGDYTLSVTDINTCTGDITFTITEPAEDLGHTPVTATDATCFNSTDGSVSATGTGGWGNYVYSWRRVSDGVIVGNTATVTGLAPGQYRLVLVDRNGTGCEITSPVATVGSPPEIVQSATITDALCNGDSNGSINLSRSGGVGSYSYSWSNGATSRNISGLAAGSYTVTITDGAGCTDTETYVVGEPAVLAASPTVTDVLCFGESTGSIDSNVTGGTAPYTYNWSYGGIITEDIDNLPAGTYSLTVTDYNGCSVTVNGITITQPAAALSKQSESLTNPTCFGGADGSITITMQGGTGSYDIDWSNGDTGATATGLTAGIHSVTVTDDNGCIYTESFTLNNPAKIAVTPSITPVTCNGGADGAISVSASNGSGSYTYSWDHGPSGNSISGLIAGSYTVTVTDQVTGCVVKETIAVTQPDVIQGNATINVISCSGAGDGSIYLTATGGSGSYSYLWDDGSTNSNRLNLGPGNYSVDITDSKGCATTENFNIVDPATMSISDTHVDLVCKGGSSGSVDITVTGGTSPYSYAWDNGSGTFTTTEDLTNVPAGTYSVIVTDAGGCTISTSVTLTEPATELVLSGTETDVTCNGGSNGEIDLNVTGGGVGYTYLWSTTATTQDVTGLTAGNYTVTVTDANGCVKSLGFTISEPAPITALESKTDVTCNGANDGTIDFTVSGGTGSYTYSWADDAGITTKNRTGLEPANYTLTIRDGNSCQLVKTFTIAEPAVLTAAGTAFEVSCFGESTGSINLTVSGGTTPYTYSWSDGGGDIEDRTGLAAGNYDVEVTDARGCKVTQSFTIIEPAAPLALTGAATDITCNGAADGIINLTITGGTAPYSYNWSDGNTNEDRSGLPASNYNVTVTDAKGCQVTASYVITDPPLLVANGSETDVSCNGAADGEIDLTVSGGGGTYTYVWTTPSGTETTEDLTGLGPGNYSVTIQDDRGCSVIHNFVITEPTAMAFGYTSSDVLCFGENNGSIDITVTGGSGGYTYKWTDGPTTEDRTNLVAGDYEVTVTDLNGCQLIRTITIAEPAATLSTTANVVDISCFGGSDGYIELTPAGGTAPYTYEWSNLQTTKDVFGLAQGSYTVKITDDNGCFIEETYTINMPTALQVTESQTNLDCNGDADGTIDLTVTGGTGPYTFTWSDIGVGPEDRSGLDGGNYTVTIADASGCSVNRSFTIVEPLPLNVNPIVTNVSCFGDANGSIDLSVSGGIAPYTYLWSNGETTQDLFNISGGTYTLDITDGNGCVSSYSYTVTEPTAALAVSSVITDENCFGDNQGAVDITVTGGTAPYTYVWNNGSTNQDLSGVGQATYQLKVTDKNGCFVVNNYTVSGPTEINVSGSVVNITCNGANDGSIDINPTGGTGTYTYLWSNGATTQDVSGLAPNTYSVTITDTNGCSEMRSFTVTEPLALSMTASVDDVSCETAADGEINVSISGGVTPYTYEWTDGTATQDRTGLSGGTYELKVTDANGCIITQSFTVAEPIALAVTANIVDETCFGDNTGEIDLTVSGGTTPYKYSWNNGVTTRDLSGLSQGTYQVTIEDANGCTIVANYTVGGPTEVLTSAVTSNVSCNGGADGLIDLTVTGGDGPYVFAWSNGETTEDISGLTAQNYSVQITDANGCIVSRSFTISQPLALNLTGSTIDVTCNGAANGAINTSVSGGVTPYTFEWDDLSSKKDRTNLSGGTYTLKVTDANGCEVTESFTIYEPDPLVGTGIVTDETCFGDNLGAIDLSVTGGTGPYKYSWNNGATTQDISNLAQGTYQVTITDDNNCVLVETFTVGGPTALNVSGIITNLTCNGAGNGEIDLTVSGGTTPYTYSWSTGDGTEDVSGLDAGNHSVTVTDANGCSVTRSFTITQPLALNLTGVTNDVTCNGAADGSIDAIISGGVTPYTYEWADGTTTQDRSGLSGGTYSLKVTDANGCEINQSFTIAEPDALVGTAVVTDEICFGDNLGAIDLSVTGGTGPYKYSWNNGATTQDISNLSQGTYQVNITDANNCVLVETFTVVGPTALVVASTVTNLTCNSAGNGEIDLAVSGGTTPYTYSWSTGDGTEDVSGLDAGNHSVTITDANGCSVTRSFTVVEPLALNLSGITADVTCNGAGDGSINASISGGVTPYKYEWLDGPTTQDRSGLNGGTYTLRVTDANNCVIEQAFTIAEPTALAVTGTVTDENCYNDAQGAIQLTVSGGTGPYTYDWDNNAITKDISGLTQGSYQVTITDANGCELVANYSVGGPTEIILSGTVSNLSCNGAGDGAIDLTVTGGVGPYTYSWGTETTEDLVDIAAGTYSVTVTDANGCSKTRTFNVTQPTILAASNKVNDVDCYDAGNGSITLTVGGGTLPYTYAWSTGATTQNVSGLDGGTYSVTIKDANNCEITQTITVGEPASPLTVLGNTSDELCFGTNSGTITLNVTGGTGPYTYKWSNGSTNKDLTGLSAGSYQVEVTDANGCKQIETYLVSSPSALTIGGVVSDISCYNAADGEIDLTVSGGTGPYTYVWSNGETTEDLQNLDEASYNVIVTDANGCSISTSFNVTQPSALAIGYTANDVDCYGANDGSILVNVTGGTAPYNYSWGDGTTSSNRTGLAGGNYNLMVTDANGCTISQTITVNEPAAPLTALETIADENCFGDNQGKIELLVSGGTAPYNYKWNNGATTQNIYGLSRGDYQVSITDANGCQIQHTYNVAGPDLFTISANETDVTCNGADDGAIDINLAGGTAPYTYAWSNGTTTEDLEDLGPGNYSVVVTDANGCTVSASYTVSEPLILTINQQVSDVTCFGANDGAIDVAVSGGNLPYTYTWSNGSGSEDLNNLAGGVYQLKVVDAKGCSVTSNIVVNAPSAPLNVTGTVQDVTCYGQPNGGVALNVTGGTVPYNYSWSNGSNQPNLVNAHAGDYSITVTDAKGCEFVASYTIVEPDALDVTFATTPVTCFGDADGAVVVAPQGGTGPYSYVWSNGSTSKDLIGISGGTYNLTVIDANNCTVTKAVVVGESSDLIVNVNKRDVMCKGDASGYIDLEVTGGSGSYTYAWDHGASEGTLTDLTAGVYQVLVTDAGGCSTTASVVIAEPAQALSATVSGTLDLICYGETTGVIEVNAVGGVGPYTYTWSNGARTNLIANVGAGTYNVIVRDANDCVVELTHTITQPTSPISIHAQGKLNLSCKDANDGRIVVDIEGGEGPYDILWSTGSRASSISNLSAGDYTVRVRDAKGCVQEKLFTIKEPEELIIANAIVNESQCYNDRNASIELNIEGGTAPYSYQWSNGATTKNLIGISSGNYMVSITDANGCQVQASYSLDSPELFEMNPDVSPISCIGAGDASISLNIAGGIDPVSIRWSNGASSEAISNLTPGEYNVLVTDKNGCTLQSTFNIFEPLELMLDAFVQDATACNNPRSGQVNVIVTGGTEPYRFRWSNGDTTSTIENVLPGTYVVEVTDKFGCSIQGTYSVLQPEPLQIGLSTQPYIDCDRRVAGILVTADVKGGVGNYNYSWSRGEDGGTDEILLTTPGRLTLEITDDRGCFQMNSIDIDIPELGEADFEYNAISLDETGDLAMNDPVSFFDLSVGEILDWHWDFGDGFDSDEIDPIHTFDASGTYTVTLTTTDRTGCTSTKTAVLDIGEGYRVMLPNAFTPNGDGNNDFFRPRLLGLTQMRLIIYNTWGEVVFSTDDIETKGWDGMVDGKRAENGNYVYKIIGKSFNGLSVERDGVFALIH